MRVTTANSVPVARRQLSAEPAKLAVAVLAVGAAVLVRDPVCGMLLEPGQAAATIARDGVTHYFCARGCRDEFEARTR